MLVHRGVPRQRGRGLGMLGGLAIKMLPKLLMGPGLGLAGSILPGLLNHGQRGSGFKDVAKNVMEKGGRRMLQAALHAGLDVVGKRRSIKDALIHHGKRAVKDMLFDNVKKRIMTPFTENKRGRIRNRKRPVRRRPTAKKRPIFKRPLGATKRPVLRRPIGATRRPVLRRPVGATRRPVVRRPVGAKKINKAPPGRRAQLQKGGRRVKIIRKKLKQLKKRVLRPLDVFD